MDYLESLKELLLSVKQFRETLNIIKGIYQLPYNICILNRIIKSPNSKEINTQKAYKAVSDYIQQLYLLSMAFIFKIIFFYTLIFDGDLISGLILPYIQIASILTLIMTFILYISRERVTKILHIKISIIISIILLVFLVIFLLSWGSFILAILHIGITSHFYANLKKC